MFSVSAGRTGMSCHTTRRLWAWVSPTLRARCSAATPLLEASVAVRSTTAQVGHNSATYSYRPASGQYLWTCAFNMLSLPWKRIHLAPLCTRNGVSSRIVVALGQGCLQYIDTHPHKPISSKAGPFSDVISLMYPLPQVPRPNWPVLSPPWSSCLSCCS